MSLQLYIVTLFSFKANESIRSLQKNSLNFQASCIPTSLTVGSS